MGFFDFLGGSSNRQLKRHADRMRNKDVQQDDRIASIHWLAENGSPEALYALLGRFEMTYEHQMKDNTEKELVEKLLSELGERSLGPLESFIPGTRQFARPLVLYEKMAGRSKALGILLQMLEEEKKRSELKAEKKRHVLIKMAEYRDPLVVDPVMPVLNDFDEGVRYAAAEVLINQEPTVEIREALLRRLAHPEEDSNRLRVRIADVASSRSWELGEYADAVAQTPPAGWQVFDGRLRPKG